MSMSHCRDCGDPLWAVTDDVYCIQCALDKQVTTDGRWHIVTATALLPIDLPVIQQIKASARMRTAVTEIAAAYQITEEA